MSVDDAFKIFKKLSAECESIMHQIKSEDDTRYQVINRILNDVLGWGHVDLLHQVTVDKGASNKSTKGYIDCLLKDIDGPLLVLEAKRVDFDLLQTENKQMKVYDLHGTVLKLAQDGIIQAQNYCIEEGVAPAVLTNGIQWIFFKAIRGDRLAKDLRKAIVFPTLSSIQDNFSVFYELLSKEFVSKHYYEIYLNKHEGNQFDSAAHYRKVVPDDKVVLVTRTELSYQLEPVVKKFFTDMSSVQDPEMLRECFVDTPESARADIELSKIAEQMFSNITAIHKDQLTAITEQILESVRSHAEYDNSEVVLIVGQTGAGKTTFIDRFFEQVLNPVIRRECILIRINLNLFHSSSREEIVSWLSDQFKLEIEKQMFKDGSPSHKELKGIFNSEFIRHSKCEWALDDEKTQDRKFLEYMGEMKSKKVFEYVVGLIKDGIVANRRRLPCLVFDNADNFPPDVQEKVFQYAQSLRQLSKHALVICPVTPNSLWGLKSTTAFDSYFTKKFYLPVPKMKDILDRRIKFIKRKVLETKASFETKPSKKASDKSVDYFLKNGIKVPINNIGSFASLLEDTFISQEFVTRLIGRLANFQIRKALELLGNIITSPQIKIDDLILSYLKMQTTDYAHRIKIADILQAAIKESHSYYDYNNKFIKNIFANGSTVTTSPLLKLRILQYLYSIYSSEENDKRGLIQIERVESYFKPLGITSSVFYKVIQELLNDELIGRYNPNKPKNEPVKQIIITESGIQHLELSLKHRRYISQISIRTPIRDEMVVDSIRALYNSKGVPPQWDKIEQAFLKYCIKEDGTFIQDISEKEEYENQCLIIKDLSKMIEGSSGEIQFLKYGS